MKKILGILMTFAVTVSMVIGMSTVSFAADENVQEINSKEEFIEFLKNGGRAVLNDDIMVIDEDVSVLKNVVLDLNGYNLIMRGNGNNYSFFLDFIVYNSQKNEKSTLSVTPNIRGTSGRVRISGKFATKDVRLFLSDYDNNHRIILCSTELTETGCGITGYRSFATLDNVKGLMTDEQFINMVNTLELPVLEREGYDFDHWEANGEAIESLEDIDSKTQVNVVWKSAVSVIFDTDGGKCDVESAKPDNGDCFSKLPIAEKEGFCFDGWFTESGKLVTTKTAFKEDTHVIARWVPEAARTDQVSKCLNELGFSQARISQIVNSFHDDNTTASAIAAGNVWMIISGVLAIVVIGLVAVLVVSRRKKDK